MLIDHVGADVESTVCGTFQSVCVVVEWMFEREQAHMHIC